MNDFDSRLRNLEGSFRAIASEYKTDWQRRAVLNWVAPSHNIPRAELRKLFEIWQLAQSTSSNGGDSDEI